MLNSKKRISQWALEKRKKKVYLKLHVYGDDDYVFYGNEKKIKRQLKLFFCQHNLKDK